MKVLILAGGFGTRLSEETGVKPKPMVEIGEKPILWHIMKIYSSYGYTEFIILLGYKGYLIKEYFSKGFLSGYSQKEHKVSRLCLKKAFTKEIIFVIKKNISDGIVKKYIETPKSLKIKEYL